MIWIKSTVSLVHDSVVCGMPLILFFAFEILASHAKSYRERCKIVSQAEFLPVRDIFVLGIS